MIPWFQGSEIVWRYEMRPGSNQVERSIACPMCGAPGGAHCVSKARRIQFGEQHFVRARLARHMHEHRSDDRAAHARFCDYCRVQLTAARRAVERETGKPAPERE